MPVGMHVCQASPGECFGGKVVTRLGQEVSGTANTMLGGLV